MKRFFPVYVRVPLLFVIFFFALEWMVGSGDSPAFIEQPVVLILLGLFLFALIALEIVASATNKILYRLMTEEERKEKDRVDSLPLSQSPAIQKIMKRLTSSKSIEKEGEIILDHDYDGIKELDNELPPWWVGLFYATIIFSVIYLLRFHVFGGDGQEVEFQKEMLAAKEAVEEYKKNAPDLLTIDNVVMLTDEGELAKGKEIFDTKCAVCHRPDGGGSIGPNLTDDYWILGGGIKDLFHTISEGGRPGKGMIAWKSELGPSDIARVASYIKTLHGTNPADPKEPEGDIWVEENASETETADEATTDEAVVEEVEETE